MEILTTISGDGTDRGTASLKSGADVDFDARSTLSWGSVSASWSSNMGPGPIFL